jgi:hypothetical protein
MSKACIFVKSPKPDTYRAIVEKVQGRLGKLESVEWIFYQTDRDSDLVPSGFLEEEVDIGIQSVSTTDELIPLLKEADLCDVSALPKEDFVEVIALVMGRTQPSI